MDDIALICTLHSLLTNFQKWSQKILFTCWSEASPCRKYFFIHFKAKNELLSNIFGGWSMKYVMCSLLLHVKLQPQWIKTVKWLDEWNSPYPNRAINDAIGGVRLQKLLGNHLQSCPYGRQIIAQNKNKNKHTIPVEFHRKIKQS